MNNFRTITKKVNILTNEDFVNNLKKSGLNKKEFAKLTELAYSTVANWSTSDNVPGWVKSWLDNYKKAKDIDIIIELSKPYLISSLIVDSTMDDSYKDAAILIYHRTDSIDTTKKIIKLASLINADPEHFVDIPFEELEKAYKTIQNTTFNKKLAQSIINLVNHKKWNYT